MKYLNISTFNVNNKSTVSNVQKIIEFASEMQLMLKKITLVEKCISFSYFAF